VILYILDQARDKKTQLEEEILAERQSRVDALEAALGEHERQVGQSKRQRLALAEAETCRKIQAVCAAAGQGLTPSPFSSSPYPAPLGGQGRASGHHGERAQQEEQPRER
jgi:hypothetical protein